MGLQQIKISDPVSAADVNRIQQAVARALEEPLAASVSVTPLQTTPGRSTYTVTTSDQYVVVDAHAGAFTVSLPTPSAKQVVTVAWDGGSVNVQWAGNFSVALNDQRRSATFVSTGSKWVRA